MDNIKNDFYYVKRILKSIEIAGKYLKDKSIDDLANDGYLCDALENRFTKISKDAQHLTKDFKESTKSIPWDGIYSIRNRVCHDYDVVDFSILYKTIKVNFPLFRKTLLDSIKINEMNLCPKPFNTMKNGYKKVEMRLFDERRKNLKIGDLIRFTNTETKEELLAEICDLKSFKSFKELYLNYNKTDIGYKENEIAKPEDMLQYYAQEQIDKYGVLAIEISVY